MTHSEIETSIRDVLQTVLGRNLAPGENLHRSAEPAWDSLKHVELIFVIEEVLGFQFAAEELGELDSFDKLVASAQKNLDAGG